jgi:beta-lactam-binding protein with PASTA domain
MRRISLVSIMMCALLVAAWTTIGCGTAVPDVKGKTAQQAEAALTAAGFRTGRVAYDEAAEGAFGAVIAQMPSAGSSSQAGAVVDLTVAGAAPVTVPSIVGMSKATAASSLAATGLTLGDVTESYAATIPAGAVIQQEPPDGTEVPRDTAVLAVVSRGPKPPPPPVEPVVHVKVPSLKGLEIAAAKTRIASAGLKWRHVLGPGNGMIAEGFVYKQSPASGTSVHKSAVVTFYTWKGP